MYNYQINILILSSDSEIEQTLTKLAIEFSSIPIKFNTARTYETSCSIDYLIIDTNFAEELTLDFSVTTIPTIFLIKQGALPQKLEFCTSHIYNIWFNFANSKLFKPQFKTFLDSLKTNRELHQTNTYLDTLINNIPSLVWFKNLAGIHLKVNDAFCDLVGKAKTDIEGKNHYYIWDIPKEVYERSDYVCLDTDVVIIDSKKPQAFDEKVFSKKGMRQFTTYKAPIFDEKDNLVGTLGCAYDITELKNINTELELILNSMPFAVLIEDNEHHVLSVNKKFREIFGIDHKTFLGKIYDFNALIQNSNFESLFFDAHKNIHLYKDNTEIILDLQTHPLFNFFKDNIGNIHIYRDVTLEKSFENQLRQLAYTDQLTGLYVRHYLHEITNTTDTRKLNLLYIDLDNFKNVNDTYGHLFGDKILCQFSDLLKTFFPTETLVRIGGDEFVVILDETFTQETIKARADFFLHEVTKIFAPFEPTRCLSASIGIAFSNSNNYCIDVVLKKSDQALYKAKKQGKNCYAIYGENNK